MQNRIIPFPFPLSLKQCTALYNTQACTVLPPANLNQGPGVRVLNLIKTDVENGG